MAIGGEVIYLPAQRRETLGSDIGGLLGAAVTAKMKFDMQQQQMQQQRMVVEGIRRAPDRAAAFEVVSNFAPLMKTPQDYSTVLRLVDDMHPASLETPTPITGYDKDTGQPTTVITTRKDMANPKTFSDKNVSLTKPDMEEFYRQVTDPTGKSDVPAFEQIGRLPADKRPPGALTKSEIELATRSRTELRQEKAGERADIRLHQSEERMRQSMERTNQVMARMAENLSDKDVKSGQSTVQSAVRLAAISMNAKQLPDGTFDFSGDANKADQFTKMVDYINTRVDANPKMLKSPTAATKLFTEARKAVIGAAEDKPAPKAAPAKPKGWISDPKGNLDKLHATPAVDTW